MNPMPELIPMLKQLRLSVSLDSIESQNRQAIEEKFSSMDFLATIVLLRHSAYKVVLEGKSYRSAQAGTGTQKTTCQKTEKQCSKGGEIA